MKERAKINTKRIGMAVGILLIGLSLFAVQIQAQTDQSATVPDEKDKEPIQENQLDKSQQDKIKENPLKTINASKVNISKEEQLLLDELIKARDSGNIKDVESIEGKIAGLHGRKLTYIKPNESGVFNDSGVVNTSALPIVNTESWDVINPCITCDTAHNSLGRPNIVHDKNGYLYTAVSDAPDLYI